MKPFLLFGYCLYPGRSRGGWSDFLKDFDTLDEAKDFAEKVVHEPTYKTGYAESFHVATEGKKVVYGMVSSILERRGGDCIEWEESSLTPIPKEWLTERADPERVRNEIISTNPKHKMKSWERRAGISSAELFLRELTEGRELWKYGYDAPLAGRWGYVIVENGEPICAYQIAMS